MNAKDLINEKIGILTAGSTHCCMMLCIGYLFVLNHSKPLRLTHANAPKLFVRSSSDSTTAYPLEEGSKKLGYAQVFDVLRSSSSCCAIADAKPRSAFEERRRRCRRIWCSASINRSWIHARLSSSDRTDSVLSSSVRVAIICWLSSASL